MKITLIISLILSFTIGIFIVACADKPANNTNSDVSSNGDAGHDMSKMPDHDMSNMNSMGSSPGAAEQPYDLQFIDSMVHHHEGALKMAKMVIGKTRRAELKSFAEKIIVDQTKEIDQMKRWRDQWYPGKPAALNMDLPGMVGGSEIMNSEHMKDMDEMDADHFDDHFLNMMTAHHEGAVTMAKDALTRAQRPEIRQLAEQVIKAQEAEIRRMKDWKSQWMDESSKKDGK